MNYIQIGLNFQEQAPEPGPCFLQIPSFLPGFANTDTLVCTTRSKREAYCFYGNLVADSIDMTCPDCGRMMHVNNHRGTNLRHLPIGSALTNLRFDRKQFYCPHCHMSKMQTVRFQAEGHRITVQLYNYARELLSKGTYTLKQVAEITGIGKNTVKDIDKKRLQETYTLDGKPLLRPEQPARYLGIDEFKLHNGYRYATHIIDMESGISFGDLCNTTGNSHLRWFSSMLESHFEGIIAHATYKISAGKIEGINNKIKTIRRQGYGYPDDEYFSEDIRCQQTCVCQE